MMDYFVKLLFISGRFLTQVAGKTILEVYYKSIDLHKNLTVKYYKATQLAGAHDNMLDLINMRVQEIGIYDGKLSACITDKIYSDISKRRAATNNKETDLIKSTQNKIQTSPSTIGIAKQYISKTTTTDSKNSDIVILNEEPTIIEHITRQLEINKDLMFENSFLEEFVDKEFDICRLILAKKKENREKELQSLQEQQEICQPVIYVSDKNNPYIFSKRTTRDLIPLIENRIKAEMDKRDCSDLNILSKVSLHY